MCWEKFYTLLLTVIHCFNGMSYNNPKMWIQAYLCNHSFAIVDFFGCTYAAIAEIISGRLVCLKLIFINFYYFIILLDPFSTEVHKNSTHFLNMTVIKICLSLMSNRGQWVNKFYIRVFKVLCNILNAEEIQKWKIEILFLSIYFSREF